MVPPAEPGITGPPPLRERWGPAAGLLAAWAVLAGLQSAWLVRSPWDGPGPVVLLDDLLVILMAGWAAWAARWRSRRCHPLHARGWRDLSAALLTFALAMTYTLVVVETLEAQGLGRALRHAGYVLGFLLLIRACLRWPVHHSFKRQELQTVLDGLAIALAAFLLAWPLFLGAWVRGAAPGGSFGFLVYPLLATVTGAAWAFQESRIPLVSHRPSVRLLRAGFACLLGFYGVYGFLSVRGIYAVFGRAERLDLLWSVSFLCFGLAALLPRPALSPLHPFLLPRRPWLAGPFLPGVAAIAGGLVFALQGATLAGPALWMALALAACLFLRLFLSLRDQERLSRSLEARVAERTEALQRSQAELVRSQRMQMIATMAAGLAHDFKNLLTVIQGWADLLESDGPEGSATHRGLQGIRGATDRAAELVRQLLTLGHQRPLHPESFDLAAFLRERELLIQGALGAGIRLDWHLPPVPLSVCLDPDHLEEVLINLAGNARDAMGGAGVLTLGLEGSPQEDPLVFAVEDSGPGIPPDVLDRLFDPFFTTKPAGEGTGLGLSTVMSLVVQNGGTIRAENRPTCGARFLISLPRTCSPAAHSA